MAHPLNQLAAYLSLRNTYNGGQSVDDLHRMKGHVHIDESR